MQRPYHGGPKDLKVGEAANGHKRTTRRGKKNLERKTQGHLEVEPCKTTRQAKTSTQGTRHSRLVFGDWSKKKEGEGGPWEGKKKKQT